MKNMSWLDIENTLKVLEEAEKTREEVAIQCPCDNCEECPFEKYCQ